MQIFSADIVFQGTVDFIWEENYYWNVNIFFPFSFHQCMLWCNRDGHIVAVIVGIIRKVMEISEEKN